MGKSLTDFKVLTFDCYGTLIDWESGIWDAFQPLLMTDSCDRVTRPIMLEAFGRAESAQQAATPGLLYPELLARCHATLARQFDLKTTAALDAAFGASLPHWPAFPDTADALRSLQKRYRLVILSNVHRDGFAASNRKLGVRFDAVYTAEDIGSYKPTPRNFTYLLEHLQSDLGLSPGDVLHTAQSLFHDHVQARAHGLANCWIDRQGLAESDTWGATAKVEQRPEVDFLYATLGAMAEAAEKGGG
jgi:2-haloalkanoic acid dehalogenase type II